MLHTQTGFAQHWALQRVHGSSNTPNSILCSGSSSKTPSYPDSEGGSPPFAGHV